MSLSGVSTQLPRAPGDEKRSTQSKSLSCGARTLLLLQCSCFPATAANIVSLHISPRLAGLACRIWRSSGRTDHAVGCALDHGCAPVSGGGTQLAIYSILTLDYLLLFQSANTL